MFDVNKLDYFIKDRAIDRDSLVKEWNISLTTYYNKRNNPSTFTFEDMEKLKLILKLSNEELTSIFFK